MAEQVSEAPVRYRFTSVARGVQLEIWELAPPAIKSHEPFLFRVKYLLATRQEAETALEDYLRNNGLSFADDSGQLIEKLGQRRLLSIRETHS